MSFDFFNEGQISMQCSKGTAKKKIVVFQPVVPQYRIGFFRALSNVLDGQLEVCATQRKQRGFSVEDESTIGFFMRNIRTISMGGRGLRLLIQPYVFTAAFRRDVSVIVAMNQMTRVEVWFLLLAKRLLRKRVILWGHGCSPRDGKLATFLRPLMMCLADAVIVYSLAGRIRAIAAGVPEDRVFVAPNALDTSEIDAIRSSIGSRQIQEFLDEEGLPGKKIFLFVGRLLDYKHPEMLIDATDALAKKYPEVVLIVIGDGSEKDVLVDLIKTRGLEQNIRLLGALFDETVLAKYYMSSIAGVMPSAAGLFIQHAFQYGLPIITDDNMQAHGPEIDLVEHGKTGLLFRSGSSQAMAEAMEQLLTNLVLCKSMAVAARQKLMTENTLEHMVIGYVRALSG